MKRLLTIYFLLLLGTIHSLSQSGLKADYFDGTEFNRYVATNYVDNINFYWNQRPPVPGINPHVCSIRYTGQLTSPKTGAYTFSARVDDGIRVWVDEVLIIDNWQLNDVGYSEGTVDMKAGTVYSLKIEYFNALNEAELRLLWKLPKEEDTNWFFQWWDDEEPVVIPTQYFSPPLEKEVAITPESALPPIVKTKPIPEPKPIAKSKPVKKKPVAIPPKKKVVDVMQQYIPKSVAFDRAKSDILPISYAELDKLADFLVKHPTRKVHIEGHTDNVGDTQKNLLLSEKRAYAVAAYLVKKGVNAKQLSAQGFGGEKPLVQSNKKYHPENRRVAFIIE